MFLKELKDRLRDEERARGLWGEEPLPKPGTSPGWVLETRG